MPQLTKAQLVDENIRLRAHAESIERDLAALLERNAHLEARLARAVEVYHTQREEIEQLRAPRTAQPAPQPVVTSYTDRFGRVWEKTRVGTRATSRLVDEAVV